MARAAQSRKNLFGWLTNKKETYRRDVRGERSDLIRQAKADKARHLREARERAASDRDDKRRLLDELKDDAYAAGQNDKQRGQKLTPYRLSLITSSRYEDAFGKRRARELVRTAYKAGYRQNPESCARTLKETVSDRAKRYRANQPGCRPAGAKKCKICRSASDIMVDHVDGDESNGRKSNLRWLCRSCNNTLGAEMARTGQGRRTVQYNPAHKGALNLGEYMQAVLQHTRGAHDAGGKVIHDTPKARRRQFASEIWARRESHGTARPRSGRAAAQDEPDWVTNPAGRANSETEDSEYSQAKKISELFHGRPVKEEITVTESIRAHDWLWRIGPLVKLKIRTLTKRNATLPFDQSEEGMVHLFCSPDGRQFYLRGGDQELDLVPLGMGPGTEWFRDHMLIGEAKEITYRDKKKFHHFKLTEYYHRLGEVTKKKPMLAYDAFAHKMQIIGGQYKVETDDLVDGMSPGIVN